MPEEINKDNLKELLQKNMELTEEIYKMTKKIKNYITFQKIVSAFYFIIIVVPIVLSIIYLPPLLKSIFSQYQDVLGTDQNTSFNGLLKNTNSTDLKNISPSLQKLLENQK